MSTPSLDWSDGLALNHPQMDQTHQEFVALLATVRGALDDGDPQGGLQAFELLIEHTVDHFGREDGWMQVTGFAPENCHTRQHATVLKLMREVVRLARDESRWEPMHVLVSELALWFPQHAQAMDAGLVQHMREVGFDPATGTMNTPPAERDTAHCGGCGCGGH
ncbi:MAG: hemerythrin domain-containing protein [Pseudomonadota bacterium]